MDKSALDRLVKAVDEVRSSVPTKSASAGSSKTRDSFVGFHVDNTTKHQITAIANADGVTLASYLRDIVKLEIIRASRGEISLRELFRQEQRKYMSKNLTDVSIHLEEG